MRAHQNQIANVRACQDVTFSNVGYHPHPPESKLAFHINYVKYDNTLTCQGLSWDSGGGGDV